MGKISSNIGKTLVLNFQSFKATIYFFCSILSRTYFIYFQVEIM